MKIALPYPPRGGQERRAYMLIEVLVYLAVVVILLGAGYAAMYHCIESSVALRRNADDITRALRAGERWRADVRSATNCVCLEGDGQFLELQGPRAQVAYRFSSNSISRRAGKAPWVCVLPQVKSSTMKSDPRQYATAWQWDLELETRAQGSLKPGRVRPLFTFLAVPDRTSTP